MGILPFDLFTLYHRVGVSFYVILKSVNAFE